MKKILVLMVVLAMAVSGCETLKGMVTSAPVNFICNPTTEQQQTAAQMLAALDAAQLVGASFFPIAGIFKASAVLTTIRAGGCFLVAELTDAFKVVDAANTATAAVQMKALKAAPAPLPEYPALRKFVRK